MLHFTASKTGNTQAENTSSSDKQVAPDAAIVNKSHRASKTKSTSPKKKHPSKPISAAKLAANRENSKRSTGPRTQEGKERVRWNAMKLGILAKTLAAIDANADPICKNLMASLAEELRPQTVAEQMMIELVAVDYWRLGRGIHHEAKLDLKDQFVYPFFVQVSRHTAIVSRQLAKSLSTLESLRAARGNGDISEIGNNTHVGDFEYEEIASPFPGCQEDREGDAIVSASSGKLSETEASEDQQPVPPEGTSGATQPQEESELPVAAVTKLAATSEDNDFIAQCLAHLGAAKPSLNKPIENNHSSQSTEVIQVNEPHGSLGLKEKHESSLQDKATEKPVSYETNEPTIANKRSAKELDPVSQHYRDLLESGEIDDEERGRLEFLSEVRERTIARHGPILD